jgi:hypothetical protein
MTKPNANEQITDKINSAMVYASVADFRDVFSSNMNGLYWLAYLMTGDHEMAERCFVTGIDHCLDGRTVFKECAQRWARRAIIKNAIRMILPELTSQSERLKSNLDPLINLPGTDYPFRNVVQLEPFERCVFVISVLEGFSDSECSLLLNSTRVAVTRGRRRAIEYVASVGV